MLATRLAAATFLATAWASAAPNALTLASSLNPSTFGHSITLTATVSPTTSAGAITFYDGVTILGTAKLASGQASLTTSQLPSGSRSLRAYYAPASDYASLTQQVNPIPANGFQPPLNFGTHSTPVSVAIADLNGDGISDLAVVNQLGNGTNNGDISILLGKGDGTFGPAVYFTAGVYPSSVAIGDFNGDGILDLAVTVTNNVSVLLGNGDGTFRPAQSYATGGNPVALVIGDFNEDGIADLAVTINNNVSVLPGNGDGTFQAPVEYAAAVIPASIAVGDFNGDGHADLVVAGEDASFGGEICVLLGNGDGTFQPAVTYAGRAPNFIAVGDFNGDGKADLAIADSGNAVAVLLGNGDGTFQAPVLYPSSTPAWLGVADINGDGNPDLVAAGSNGAAVSVLLGNGDGTFQAPFNYNAGSSPKAVAIGDFNGDGKADLAVADRNGSNVSILLGTVLLPATTVLNSSPNPSEFNQIVTLTATVSPSNATGTITFYDGSTTLNTVPLTNGVARFPDTPPTGGQHILAASYSGDSRFAASNSAPVVQVVTQIPTTIILSTSANPATPGQNVTLTATVGPSTPGGTVTYFDGATVLGSKSLANGQAALNTTFTTPGTHSLTASYSGNTQFASSASNVVVQLVNNMPAPTILSLSSSLNPSTYGRQVALHASISTPMASGKITFYDGTSVLGSSQLSNGQATLTTSLLASGTRMLRTYYAGDLNNHASTSPSLTQTVSASAANGFLSPRSFSTGALPDAVAVGDFNGDGKQDLAVANRNSRGVSVLLANGDGTFQPAVNYTCGLAPISLSAGDFNGDGVTDLAIANNGDNTVSVLLGNGDGTFQAALTFTAGNAPVWVVTADFNGDGNADLAIANTNGASILLGNGDGTFQVAVNFKAGINPFALAVADFNGDGNADLAVASQANTVGVLLGNGDGSFQPLLNFVAGTFAQAVAAGDFNGDGKADLAVGNEGTGNVSVLLGNGDGTFQPAMNFAAGSQPRSIVVGDFDGDGKPDLAVVNLVTFVSVLSGNGDGTFQAPVSYPAGTSPYAVAAGDFNGDGKTDLAVVNYNVNSVSVLLGRLAAPSTATLSSSSNPAKYGQGVTLMAAVSPATAGGSVTFYDGINILGVGPLSNGQAVLTTSLLASGFHSLKAYYAGSLAFVASTSPVLMQTVGTASAPANGYPSTASFGAGLDPQAVAVGDFNGDGKADVAIANFGGVAGGSSVSVLLGNGDDTFQTAVNYSAGNGPIALAAGDFNADGKIDLVVANFSDNTVSVLLGNGDGSFQQPVNFAAGIAPTAMGIGDFNGDGKLDLAVINFPGTSSGSLSVLLGNGDGTFRAPLNTNSGTYVRCVAIGDFNGDGIADLAIGSSYNLSILLGNGDGSFQAPAPYAYGLFYSVAVGDFNGDGKPDLALTYYSFGDVYILLGNGDGSFSLRVSYVVGTYPRSVVAGDFNGDGKIDLAVANFGGIAGGSVSILNGNGDGTFQAAVNYPSNSNPDAIAIGDFNSGGRPDFIVANENNNISVLMGGFLPASSVTLSVSPNPVKLGQTVTLTANVSPPDATGEVTFFIGGTAVGANALAGGRASLAFRFTVGGSLSLKAYYNGSGSYAPSTSPVVIQNVAGTLTPITLSLTSSSNPANLSQTINLTATLSHSDATGRITFYDGATVLASRPVSNGQAQFTTDFLASGTRSLKASYNGDANYATGSSTVLTQLVKAVVSTGFQTPTTYPSGKNPFGAAAGDFNGDGNVDLAVANSGDNTVSVMLGNGDGTFQPARAFSAGTYPYSVAIGDFNGDGIADLAVSNNGGNNVSILLGNGDGTFQRALNYAAGSGPYSVVTGDFNNDGWIDLAVANQLSNNVSILLGNGDGTFQALVNYAAGTYPDSIAITDVSGDGIPDLLVADQFGGVSLLVSRGDGTFVSNLPFYSGAPGFSGQTAIVAGDLGGNGKTDIAISSYGGGVTLLLLGVTGYLPATYPTGLNPWSLAAGDIDGDGKPDLVVANEGGNGVSVLRGNGDGTYQAPLNYNVGNQPVWVVIGDFNGDGRADLATINYADNTVTIQLGAAAVTP